VLDKASVGSGLCGRSNGQRKISYSDFSGNKTLVSIVAQHASATQKKYQPNDWQLTMEQFGRELRKIYRQPKQLPRRLRVLVTGLERKVTMDYPRNREPEDGNERG
jgi:hypothetical protein